MLSMTSDYAAGTGCPEPHLRRIAEAGFSHVHWCHQWCTDFLYTAPEIRQIQRWICDFRLSICDVHASHGKEKAWGDREEYRRLAGLDLVRNRIQFAEQLGADVIILHLPSEPQAPAEDTGFRDRLRRSIDALLPELARRGVRLAFENMGSDNFPLIADLCGEYGPERIGLCYDSGHGNLNAVGLDRLDALRDRLIAVHLHDNDGQSDQHLPPFQGTVDWARLTAILAGSSYTKPLSFEVSIRNGDMSDEAEFLAFCYRQAETVQDMCELHRSAGE